MIELAYTYERDEDWLPDPPDANPMIYNGAIPKQLIDSRVSPIFPIFAKEVDLWLF